MKQGEEEVSIVAKDTRYVSNVKDVASYTTGELDPGEYRVVVVSDFVRGDKEFNWLDLILRLKDSQLYVWKM